jgi:hypothetical protein
MANPGQRSRCVVRCLRRHHEAATWNCWAPRCEDQWCRVCSWKRCRSELLLRLSRTCLSVLLRWLWVCGQCDSVVQAKRHIHSGNSNCAKPRRSQKLSHFRAEDRGALTAGLRSSHSRQLSRDVTGYNGLEAVGAARIALIRKCFRALCDCPTRRFPLHDLPLPH